MILISHRGNILGPQPDRENSPEYIDDAIAGGYEVEIDLRAYGDNLFCLGHDYGQYPVSFDWLLERADFLWIHTKNIYGALKLRNTKLRFFFHEKERHSLIHNTPLIWTHDLSETTTHSIIPLLDRKDWAALPNFSNVYGVCSDFVGL